MVSDPCERFHGGAVSHRSGAGMVRAVFVAVVGALVLLGLPTALAASAATARPAPDPATSVPRSTATAQDQEPTTTSEIEPTTSVATSEPQPTATSEPERSPHDDGEEQPPTSLGPESTTPEDGDDNEATTPTAVAPIAPGRPSTSPRVRDSQIPLGSIVLSIFVLAGIGAVSYRLSRRQSAVPESAETPSPSTSPPPETTTPVDSVQPIGPTKSIEDRSQRDRPGIAPATADFLIGLGEALMDAGAAVSHVESALRSVAAANGAVGVGVIVLPTAFIVSVPNEDDLVTEIGAPGRAQLRFDQIEDLLRLVRDAEAGEVGASEGNRRLAMIRSATPRYPPQLVVLGSFCTAAGVAAILHGTWVEVALAALLGAAVGLFRLWTARLNSSYKPFVALIAASAVSASVFALTRVMGDLLTFPVLIAPLITFLPGGLLTIAILELATGQIVSGASRLASGGLQLVLLAIGLVAGAQLVGVPAPDLTTAPDETVMVLIPWIGIAVYGFGVVWVYGARSSARIWILLVMFVAYAGQVIGGLFFGSSLSAFFGALAMTPVAVLAARRATAPSPLVTLFPAFWLLVPGALGLTGVTGLFGASGVATSGALVTTVTSMVGVSLGILLGLLLVARDPARPFSEALVADPASPSPDPHASGTSPTTR